MRANVGVERIINKMVTIIQRPIKQVTYYGFECYKCGCKFTADEEDINIDIDMDNGILYTVHSIQCPWCKSMGYYSEDEIMRLHRTEEIK